MKNNLLSNVIDKILRESSLDTRIETGIFDIHNHDHMEIMAEHMALAGVSEDIVADVMNELVMDEGKYPERQAYNKDGWLVTFPSAEYKQNAIKKGTHFGSDPTHGSGGMNLYYKKRGKQKRQTQQSTTSTEPIQQVAKKFSPVSSASPQTLATTIEPSAETQPATKEKASNASDVGGNKQPANATGEKLQKSLDSTPVISKSSAPKSIEAPSGKEPEPANSATEIPTPAAPPNYVFISSKFATDKGWTKTPYGEWRDPTGNTSAIVALSGEVVPVKSVERDELKLIADKNKT